MALYLSLDRAKDFYREALLPGTSETYVTKVIFRSQVQILSGPYAHVAQWLLQSVAARLFPGSNPGVRLFFLFEGFRWFYKAETYCSFINKEV